MPRLPAAAKVRRDERIVADRARGLRWQTIAERHRVSERHARQVWTERLAAEALLQVEAAIEELALLAEATRNDPVRLGAIRARLEAMASRVTLLRMGGFLPYTPRDAMVEADIRLMADQIRATLKKHNAPAGLLEDLIAALDQPAGRINGRAP